MSQIMTYALVFVLLLSATVQAQVPTPVQSALDALVTAIKNAFPAPAPTPPPPLEPPPPPTPAARLLQQSDLVYEGAFRVPLPTSNQKTYAWGNNAIAYKPSTKTLLMVGMDWYQEIGEFSIPVPLKATSIAQLPRAAAVKPLTDLLQGRLNSVDGLQSTEVKIGGMVELSDGRLAISAWRYYDTCWGCYQTRGHFIVGPNGVSGPFQVGTGYDANSVAGIVAGYMAPIPPQWQPQLGGTHLTGLGGGVSVVRRSNSGPGATIFSPAQFGVQVPLSGTIGIGYPIFAPTLGTWGGPTGGANPGPTPRAPGVLYDGSQYFHGMVFPATSRSVLFFGSEAKEFCYGGNTSDPNLHGKPIPNGGGQIYCYDPIPGHEYTGPHGYPYFPIVFAYDVLDLIAVKAGQKKPQDLKPYATWRFTLPFQERIVNGVDLGEKEIKGAAYDPQTNRIYVVAYRSDGDAPVIHAFKVP